MVIPPLTVLSISVLKASGAVHPLSNISLLNSDTLVRPAFLFLSPQSMMLFCKVRQTGRELFRSAMREIKGTRASGR